MLDSALSSVVAVDTNTDAIVFYTMHGNDRNSIQYSRVDYKVRSFDEDFFAGLGDALALFRERFPQTPWQKTALILPDRLFLTDTVKVPVIHRRAMQHALTLAVEARYKNAAELKLNTEVVQQNKKYVTCALTGVRKELLERLNKTCGENHVGIQGVTYAANAAVNGAMALNPKLKNGTFLLLDIKETSARFAFAVKGRTMGYYSLPFGFSVLHGSRVVSEELLFDHGPGELLVLNAKERARAQHLTMADGSASQTSVPLRRPARKLPKSLARPTPQSREAFVYENFRIFMKWALELAAGNPDITEVGVPETVYVNMPPEYEFLCGMANAERAENQLVFAPLLTGESADGTIAGHLELFGGFYINQYNKSNVF